MNEAYKDFDDLLKGFVEGTLSSSNQLRFEQMLKTDSAARQRYLDYITVESMLSSHRVKVEYAEMAPSKTKLKISSERTARVKRKAKAKPRNSGAFLILAASLFLALSLGYYMKFIKKPDAITVVDKKLKAPATLGSLSGKASFVFAGKTVQATEGMTLKSGTEIICTGSTELTINCSDGTSLKLAPSSHLIFTKENEQIKLNLKKGFLTADVSKQPAGKPLLVSTPEAGLTVLGTTLRVGLIKKSTILTVDEGRVQLQNKRKEQVTVNADESVIAQSGKPLKVRNIKEFKVNNLEIIRAVYGAQDKWVNLTAHLRSMAGNSRLIHTGLFFNLAGDPLHLVVKEIEIDYKIDGKAGSVRLNEYFDVDARIPRNEVVLPEL